MVESVLGGGESPSTEWRLDGHLRFGDFDHEVGRSGGRQRPFLDVELPENRRFPFAGNLLVFVGVLGGLLEAEFDDVFHSSFSWG